MCSEEQVLSKLRSNSKEAFDEASRLLVKIADNILADPHNVKLRTLQKSNAVVSRKILSATGGGDCLKCMGFAEREANFVLPMSTPLEQLKNFKDKITKQSYDQSDEPIKNTPSVQSNAETIKKFILPPFVPIFTNPFLKQVQWYFHEMLAYEDKDLQARARKLIPVCKMESAAQVKLRRLQERIKKSNLKDPELSVQDMLILELLSWFKEEFFTWVDSPDCDFCGGETKMSHMANDPSLFVYTDRIEMHVCKSCGRLTPFPRYNDLNILLETRKGRCGEWAKVFTLLCRCLGWDARFVVDQGDHVWTEVYSVTQKRWLHCDACENVCDAPLIYESGWNKRLTYVIAYSAEEVQDVTWRYSSQHKQILARRNACGESELTDALLKLRAMRWETLTEARRRYLTKRTVQELVELMVEKEPNDVDKQGRVSGSAAWKLARGEIEEEDETFVWEMNADPSTNGSFQLRYSPSSDSYETNTGITLKGWNSGAFHHRGVFRKVEKDWKMVYISRTENAPIGSVSWKFSVRNDEAAIDKVDVRFLRKTYENGLVTVSVSNDKAVQVDLEEGQENLSSCAFNGGKALTITAKLEGGEGDVAWQHAQLFRQSIDDDFCPFCVTLTFKGAN